MKNWKKKQKKLKRNETFFCNFATLCIIVATFLLQNIYHPRTSESLPPNYNMPPERRPELHQRIRVIRHDDVRTGSGESRSELLIQQTSPNDNGTYYCEAVNKAASSVSNFTLHVTDSVDAPTILQVRNATVVENQSKKSHFVILWAKRVMIHCKNNEKLQNSRFYFLTS